MSQIGRETIDRPSHVQSGQLVDVTTDGVPARERLGFWRDVVLKRNRPLVPDDGQPFQARLRRIVLDDMELVEHASDALSSDRLARRSSFDGGEDIAVELMRKCQWAALQHNGEHALRAGDLYVVDYAQELRTRRSRHRASGIVLSRRAVAEALGRDPAGLAGRRLPARGLAAVLRRHLVGTIDEAARMATAQRVTAVRAAADMALALLQTSCIGRVDGDRFAGGLYEAARRYIADCCMHPELTPDRVAMAMGCSRASLYRAFVSHDESIGAAIWSARLERAHGMLVSAEGIGMTIVDISLLCGFREITTFTRMFRRRYGTSPGKARDCRRSTAAPVWHPR